MADIVKPVRGDHKKLKKAFKKIEKVAEGVVDAIEHPIRNTWFRKLIFWRTKNDKDLPAVPWTVTDGIKMVFLTFFILVLGGLGAIYGAGYVYGPEKVYNFFQNNMITMIVSLIFLQVIIEMFLLYWYTKRKYHCDLKVFGFRETPIWETFFLAFFIFLAAEYGQRVVITTMNYVGIHRLGEQTDLLQLILDTKDQLWWFWLIFAGVIAPVTEEIIYRGVLLPSCVRKFRYEWGVIIASFVFAIAHITLDFSSMQGFLDSIMSFFGFTFPFLFILGSILSVLYIRTKSLWPGIIFHSINNTIGTWIILFLMD